MLRIQAPYPAYKSTLVLPSPEMGNTRNLAATVQPIRTMDGTLYTFIKDKRGRRVHRWDFIISASKYEETKAFVDAYMAKVVRITDHEDVVHLGNLTLNPVEFNGDGRAGGWPGPIQEAYRVSLQLEELV